MASDSKRNLIIVLALVLALIGGIVWTSVYSVGKYFDNNTWASIRVSGVAESETSDAFEEEHEYLQGDRISIGNVTLLITDITHDGDVSYKVEQGRLMDDGGEEVTDGILHPDQNTSFRLDNGYVDILITRHWYA